MNDSGAIETMEEQKKNENQQEGEEYDTYQFERIFRLILLITL